MKTYRALANNQNPPTVEAFVKEVLSTRDELDVSGVLEGEGRNAFREGDTDRARKFFELTDELTPGAMGTQSREWFNQIKGK